MQMMCVNFEKLPNKTTIKNLEQLSKKAESIKYIKVA